MRIYFLEQLAMCIPGLVIQAHHAKSIRNWIAMFYGLFDYKRNPQVTTLILTNCSYVHLYNGLYLYAASGHGVFSSRQLLLVASS